MKNSVLKSHLSCQRADTGHPGTWGLWCSESGHWPSFPPLLSSTTQPTPSPHSPLQHPTYKTLLSRPISSVLYCHPDLNELPSSSHTSPPSLHFALSCFLSCFHFFSATVLILEILSHLENRNKRSVSDCKQITMLCLALLNPYYILILRNF